MGNEHDYKGHHIRLLARKLDDGQWSCSYTVIRFGKTTSEGFSGFKRGATEDDSKKRALEKAKQRIDSLN